MLPTKPVTQDRIQLNELAEIVPDDSDTGETETDPESPLIVEDMVAQYAGVFPMDVAIIEGKGCPLAHIPLPAVPEVSQS